MSLAIIVPAYKPDFLKEAIESIINQTNHNFILYIYNDASPFDLDIIIYPFLLKYSNIKYNKFEKNFGGNDLVSHWNRCIDSTSEEWIWLFSDDDIMGEFCVENFYKTLQLSNADLYRFNTEVFSSNNTISTISIHPEREDVLSFLKNRLERKINSFVVEYIFSREIYLSTGKFVNFPLAWASDDATWIKFGMNKGIHLISQNDVVKWRYSELNISSGKQNIKIDSSILFIKWCDSLFLSSNTYHKIISKELKENWIYHQINLVSSNLYYSSIVHYSKLLSIQFNKTFYYYFILIYIKHSFLFSKPRNIIARIRNRISKVINHKTE